MARSTQHRSITETFFPANVLTMAISVASALVSSQLDYANSVLFGCPQKHAARLQ